MSTTLDVSINLPTLHAGQQEVKNHPARFKVLDAGRRWGKSTLLEDLAVYPALEGHPVGWFAPTYKMMAEVWRDLLHLLPRPFGTPHVSENRIELAGGGLIELWSLEDPDKARGRKYKRILVDEAAMVRELLDVWQRILRPTLVDLEGDAAFGSTPRGFNDFEVLFGWGQDAERPDWMAWRKPTGDNPHIPASEIEAARRELPPAVFGQEYLADFLSDANAVFTVGLDLQPWLQRIPTPDLMPHQTWVYRHPDPRLTYLLGVDVAEGLEHGDRSCCIVLERDSVGRCVEAAHLCGTYPTDQWAEMVDGLGAAYGGIVGVERNNHGHAVLDHLRRFEADRISRGIRQPYRLYREQPPLKSPTSVGTAIHHGQAGWATTIASKPVLIDELEEALRTGLFLFGSERLQRQLRAYQRDDKGKMGAPAGKHDDCILSAGIAFQMRKWAQTRAGYTRLKAVNMNLGSR